MITETYNSWNLILQAIIGLATVVILIVTARIYWLIAYDSKKNAIREATQNIFNEWWGDDLYALRKYYYKSFLNNQEMYKGKGLKEIDDEKIRQLCYFFDRVGWLGAAGLIDVDYILGPMQAFLRRFWLNMDLYIKTERDQPKSEVIDAVYLAGFQWLFKRSQKINQADLIENKFKNPSLFTKNQIRDMKNKIADDENKFEKELLAK